MASYGIPLQSFCQNSIPGSSFVASVPPTWTSAPWNIGQLPQVQLQQVAPLPHQVAPSPASRSPLEPCRTMLSSPSQAAASQLSYVAMPVAQDSYVPILPGSSSAAEIWTPSPRTVSPDSRASSPERVLQLREAAAAPVIDEFPVGSRVQAFYQGEWYNGTVVATPAGNKDNADPDKVGCWTVQCDVDANGVLTWVRQLRPVEDLGAQIQKNPIEIVAAQVQQNPIEIVAAQVQQNPIENFAAQVQKNPIGSFAVQVQKNPIEDFGAQVQMIRKIYSPTSQSAPSRCTACGHAFEPGSAFCRMCGQRRMPTKLLESHSSTTVAQTLPLCGSANVSSSTTVAQTLPLCGSTTSVVSAAAASSSSATTSATQLVAAMASPASGIKTGVTPNAVFGQAIPRRAKVLGVNGVNAAGSNDCDVVAGNDEFARIHEAMREVRNFRFGSSDDHLLSSARRENCIIGAPDVREFTVPLSPGSVTESAISISPEAGHHLSGHPYSEGSAVADPWAGCATKVGAAMERVYRSRRDGSQLSPRPNGLFSDNSIDQFDGMHLTPLNDQPFQALSNIARQAHSVIADRLTPRTVAGDMTAAMAVINRDEEARHMASKRLPFEPSMTFFAPSS